MESLLHPRLQRRLQDVGIFTNFSTRASDLAGLATDRSRRLITHLRNSGETDQRSLEQAVTIAEPSWARAIAAFLPDEKTRLRFVEEMAGICEGARQWLWRRAKVCAPEGFESLKAHVDAH